MRTTDNFDLKSALNSVQFAQIRLLGMRAIGNQSQLCLIQLDVVVVRLQASEKGERFVQTNLLKPTQGSVGLRVVLDGTFQVVRLIGNQFELGPDARVNVRFV